MNDEFQPEPSNLIQFVAVVSFVGACIALLIVAAIPVPV